MNQDEAWIGKVMAAGLIGLALWGITALLQAQGEGARRVRLVIGAAVALGAAAVLFAIAGPGGFFGALVVLAAAIWVFKGFNKKDTKRPASEKHRKVSEPDATEFEEVREIKPERKTIVTCPNCNGRLRVVAGKYIDVTCPHCDTVFRTHT